MRQFICITSLALCVATHAAQFKIGAHNFTLPDGFEIELVAGTNLAPRPIEADFDEQGRLYVTDSSGSNDKVQKQLEEKPHRVVRLEDSDGDGRFDKSIVFADKMMFPEGAMWLDGSLYVAAPPSIWKLTDTNSDGVADVRVEWFKGQSLGGCANDLHGPYAGPDGWIYWCKGGFVKQTNTLWNGKEFISRASHIYRARPDGTDLEPVMAGGMDNPVGLAFTAEGERIVSGTFFQNPAGGKRDGLNHAIYGGVYGKENDALDGHPRTGDLMPIMTHLGPAAPAGLMRYESAVFGDDFQNNLFAACFNLHKITRHILEPNGATYKTTDSDFLVSDNTDFHPTDVFEDADGSLLVIDTGGWYKLCCPTSQLQKPDVLGGIYRIRRKGATTIADPRGLKLKWQTLRPADVGKFLDDARPCVRRAAIDQLARKGQIGVPVLRKVLQGPSTVEARRNAVWALTRISFPEARNLMRDALMDRDESVRWAAIHWASVWRDVSAIRELGTLLFSGNAGIRRAAAEALGRMGQENAVFALLAAVAPVKGGTALDRTLEHSLIYALIEIGDASGTARWLQADDAETRRVALIALDQMPGGNLKPEQVTPLLSSTNALLKQTASWIVSRHADWGDALADYLSKRLHGSAVSGSDASELQRQLTDFARHESVQKVIAAVIADDAAPKENRLVALRAMAQARPKQTPTNWPPALAKILSDNDSELQRQAVLAARNLGLHGVELTEALRRLVGSETTPADIRLNAFAAIKGLGRLSRPAFQFLQSQLAPTNAVATRLLAAEVLARAPLTANELSDVTKAVRTASPLELPKLLAVFSRATNEQAGLELIDALKQSASVSSLRAEILKPNLTNFPAVVRQRADELLASIHTDTAQEKARIDELLESCKNGDVRRGQALFNSPKAACSSCHAIGYLGGNVGPDLTRIGQIRNERDLLEALVYPNASFVRSYEPMIVATKSGEEYSGVLRKDSADEVVLATGPNIEQRIARSDIADMRPGTVSVMPSGLADQLKKEELADLLAFLKATRW